EMVADPAGELEDWRLFALADSASRGGDDALADRALALLLDRGGESPLRGRALIVAAQRAWDRGQTERALNWVELARAQKLAPLAATEVDVLAWRIGVALGDRTVERTAAKRLLVGAPTLASELRVGDVFRDETGRIDSWDGVLSRSEVQQRAEKWLAADQGLAASNTLTTIPVADRDVTWYLLQSEALTQQGQGGLAYSLLRSVFPDTKEEEAKLEWQRALAAADVATARPGRANLDSGERTRMLATAQHHLRRVVDLDVDTATSVPAVRKLYGILAEAGRFDESMEMLALLRKLDPADRTGATHLWELGWKEFEHKNYSSAVGYWTQLEQLYPQDKETHRGRYWKGRALEELGQKRRADEMYRAVLADADTADFYVRQASMRLGPKSVGEQPAEQQPGGQSPEWPAAAAMRRVLVLSNFGLDPLARVELAGLANPDGDDDHARDLQALDGILTVREGNPRKGVQLLRAAFPALGGPFQATVPLPVLEAYYPLHFDDAIRRNAEKNGLPPALVAGIIRQESSFDTKAQSWAGARGLMQLMPATAKEWAGRLGVSDAPEKLFDPSYSIRMGTAYFANVLRRMDGNVELALAGYNGGPNRILRKWREAGGKEEDLDLFLERLDISESQAYVKRILVLADSYRQLYPEYAGKQSS
ncbi:MAG TPA: transglycosylase SLT domain-containing protein, partial [Thermoanaerobaculia bacterium]|nr:transglycosylase SLT domain-containing protein [Thermoanaerobaculia bacterium]